MDSDGVGTFETAMLRLYGFQHSSYYSMVKVALLEKGIPFDEIPLALKTTGKLDVPRGYLAGCPRNGAG